MIMIQDEASLNYYRIEEAIRYLEDHFREQPSLDELAEKIHLSPYHFQRLFAEWAGISPKRFLQHLTVEHLKQNLVTSRNLIEAAEQAGLSSQSRVYDLFTTLEAVTPGEYRDSGMGITIRYGFHVSPFGRCLVGVTGRGICWFSFLQKQDKDPDILDSMKAHWHNSNTIRDDVATEKIMASLFGHAGGRQAAAPLHLFVKGTNFQVKVWRALLQIPPGRVITYQEIAHQIDQPTALQAVGSAVGANRVAWLIPCHRVIRKDGVLGDYRWGAARKKMMLGLEMAEG